MGKVKPVIEAPPKEDDIDMEAGKDVSAGGVSKDTQVETNGVDVKGDKGEVKGSEDRTGPVAEAVDAAEVTGKTVVGAAVEKNEKVAEADLKEA